MTVQNGWQDANYPAKVFGQSKDTGAVFVTSIRNALEALRPHL